MIPLDEIAKTEFGFDFSELSEVEQEICLAIQENDRQDCIDGMQMDDYQIISMEGD